MKILFLSSSSGSRGGGELYLLFLAEAFASQDVTVGLWCSTHSRMDELAESFRQFGEVFRSPYKNTYDYTLRSVRYFARKKVDGLSAILTDFKPDIVHVNKQNLEDGLDLLQTVDALKLPYVTTIHITQTQESLGALCGRLRDSVSRRILKQSKSLKWIAISSTRSRDLKNFLESQNDNVMMIPNGVKQSVEAGQLRSRTRDEMNIPNNNLVIVSVGRLESQKDPMKFIDWAVQCLKFDSRLNFFWIGDGSLRTEFEEKVRSLQLSESIICLGWQKAVIKFYAMADIYIHTAQYEGLPFSILEAMSWKLPCVVSKELYEDLAFHPEVLLRDFEGLKTLIQNRHLTSARGEQAYAYFVENFALEKITKAYLIMYKNVLQ
jgi:glycosyltransferase involved in cell wall biosynthesis